MMEQSGFNCKRVSNALFYLLFICLNFYVLHAQQTRLALYPAKNDSALSVISSSQSLLYPSLVADFYKLYDSKPFWYAGNQTAALRRALLNLVDSAAYVGLDSDRYHYKELHAGLNENVNAADTFLNNYEKIYTDAAIAYMADVYKGDNISSMIDYDDVSTTYNERDNQFILNRLVIASSPAALGQMFIALHPSGSAYNNLKTELQVQLKKKEADTVQQLASSLQLSRWINHFHFKQYVVVNIASATLDYYQNDSSILTMKVVVGKPSTQTPRLAAYCNKVILYPYWYVPISIALKELLPQFKENTALVNEMNMQVLDANGTVLNPDSINWSTYSRSNFPYHFRQSTGCNNSLGVIKFNLTDTLSVYMHDTNNKDVFLSSSRHFSHGCIRLEKPIALANVLLPNSIDSHYLQSCLRDQQPVTLNINEPVPVFVIYSTVQAANAGKVMYYKDVYHVFKRQ